MMRLYTDEAPGLKMCVAMISHCACRLRVMAEGRAMGVHEATRRVQGWVRWSAQPGEGTAAKAGDVELSV